MLKFLSWSQQLISWSHFSSYTLFHTVLLFFMPSYRLLSSFASQTLMKLFINKPVFSIQRYINKPPCGSVSQHSGKSYAILKNCKSPLLLPIAQIKNTLLPPWHPLLIFKGKCICSHSYLEVLNLAFIRKGPSLPPKTPWNTYNQKTC